jgi:hypothetical protein
LGLFQENVGGGFIEPGEDGDGFEELVHGENLADSGEKWKPVIGVTRVGA